jgi:Glyoxalase-like domain
MTVSLAQVVFDCKDAAALAGFWSRVLDQPIDPGANPFFATIGRAAGESRPAWMFIQVPEPKAVKNRLHLDLTATDWKAEAARIAGLGAVQVAEHQEFGTHWVTLLDPEGNEFDLGAGIG